ncbi:peptidoglycan-binding protein [Streptomyces sp. NPDC085900]|uniref:peptidoglycan-binding protein n=1 Tax=Streptomyces sp. NPDC085900 TaxID=3365737 RepID=UPI0037D640CF
MVALSNVRFGQTNEDIRTVQKALIARGRKIPAGATGHFGEETRAAYRAEQLAHGFTGADADGIPGCASLTALGRHAGFSVDCTGAAVRNGGRLSLSQVTYHDPHNDFGEAAMRRYAGTACQLSGMDPKYGVPALITITKRESAYNNPKYRVNDSDSNARGPLAPDGHRQNCSRGATQCIPATFAAYHQAGTATTPYDVVADMCATINYVRDRYHVNQSGSNFTALVQQADPKRPPHGY